MSKPALIFWGGREGHPLHGTMSDSFRNEADYQLMTAANGSSTRAISSTIASISPKTQLFAGGQRLRAGRDTVHVHGPVEQRHVIIRIRVSLARLFVQLDTKAGRRWR